MLDPDTLKYVYEKHPSICEAASQLSAAVHEEKPSAKSNNDDSEGPMPPFAYNMDEMSDDDDDEEEMEVGEGNRYDISLELTISRKGAGKICTVGLFAYL